MSASMISSLVVLFLGIATLIGTAFVYFKWEDGKDRLPYVTIGMFVVGSIMTFVAGMGIIADLI